MYKWHSRHEYRHGFRGWPVLAFLALIALLWAGAHILLALFWPFVFIVSFFLLWKATHLARHGLHGGGWMQRFEQHKHKNDELFGEENTEAITVKPKRDQDDHEGIFYV